jgi:DeoR/GlpR family transcriptional regulator of sugar metabolism
VSGGPLLKEERQARILDLLATSGRVVATELQDAFGVSGYTIRRDLDELARDGAVQRVHGGALGRSRVADSYDGRQAQEVEGKRVVARAAAALLRPGEVAILDGGSTALALVDAIPAGHTGTFVTHSPPVAAALARHPGIEVVVVGGSLDARAMVCVGAQALEAYRRIAADVCFLGVWSVHAERGISERYFEEADVRRLLLDRADRVVGLASRDKLATVAPFAIGPAEALTHLAVEPGLPDELITPFAELGIELVTA